MSNYYAFLFRSLLVVSLIWAMIGSSNLVESLNPSFHRTITRVDATSKRHTIEQPHQSLGRPNLHPKERLFPRTNIISLALAVFLCTQQAAGAGAVAPEAYVFNHEYADPLHPECKRKIQVNKDGQTFKYSGTAVGDPAVSRGCTYAEIKEYGIRRESFEGRILAGNQLDFLGDGTRIGLWESVASDGTDVVDADGIRWGDNDKWIVKEKPLSTVIGEYIFLAYIGFSTLAGFKGVYDGIQRKRKESQA